MKESKYGDFEEIKEESKENKKENVEEPQVTTRAKMPQRGQLIGIVLQRLGGNRMSIKATDNKIRNCRVPGRFSRKFWLRPGNIVIIAPWSDDNNKGDVVYQYKSAELLQLKKLNLLKNFESEF